MAKCKSNDIELINSKEEIQLLEQSVELADGFIEETLLPKLDEFETRNEDPDYVFGIATYSLFAALVQRMGLMGYTEKDLRRELKVYLNTSVGQTLH